MANLKIILLAVTLITIGLVCCHAQAASKSNFKQGIVNSHDQQIFYRVCGQGSPLLMINGGPGMSSLGFIPLALNFSQDHIVILFDQRGTGNSEIQKPISENITMDLMIDDMEAIRKQLGIKQWAILGHSFGGMLAAYYTTKHPDKVSGLVFSSSGGLDLQLFDYLDITGRLTPSQRDSLLYWNEQINRGDTSYHAAYQRGLYLAPAYLFNKEYVPNIAKRLTQGNMEINRLVLENMQEIQFDCKPDLQNFSAPILVIQGSEDIIARNTAEITKEVMPQTKIVILENCGHYGWLDRKKAYINTIKEFLAQTGE